MRTKLSEALVSLALATLVALTAGCQKSALEQNDSLAVVGSEKISAAEFANELEERMKAGQAVHSLAQRENILQEMVRFETLFAKAKAAGVDRDPKLSHQFKRMVVAKFEETERQKNPALSRPEPGETETYYQAHREQFTNPEKIHVAILFLRVPNKAAPEQQAKFQETAASLHQRALAEEASDFGMLAQENSDDQATRYRGGDCGWITRENSKYGWDRKVLDRLFELRKPGEITSVIRGADGYYIGKLIEAKPAITAPLEAVRDRIEHQLVAAKQKREREQFLQKQRHGVAVSINQDLLQKIEVPKNVARTSEAAPAMPAK